MTSLRNARYPLVAALLVLACQPVLAAGDEDEEEQEPWNARWSLAGVLEVDQQSNRGLEAEVGYLVTPTTSVRVAGNSTAYSQTLSNGFHSAGIELGAAHEFKRFTLSAALGRWQDSDILTATEGRIGADLHFRPWSIGATALYRRSDFEPLNVNTTVTLSDGTALPVLATSTCKLNNTGLGAHGEYAGRIWGGHASFTSYQYKAGKCSFGDVLGLDALDRPDKNEFAQLEATLVDQLSTIGVRRIGRENTLMSSEMNAGASWRHQDFIVSLDYTRQTDYFSGNGSNTLFATGTADMGHNSGVDLVLGLTRGSTISGGAFVGFAVRAHF